MATPLRRHWRHRHSCVPPPAYDYLCSTLRLAAVRGGTGGFTFTVRVRDQTGARNTEPFSIRINPPRPVAINCQQGGLFQMEPEPGTRERNTLGDGFEYTNQPQGEERLCFTNGRVPGYDSPQLATLISNDAKTATWRVQAGGRIGMVIGEDAVEGGCSP